MKKRIWASLDDYLPPTDGAPYLGRTMANHYFFSALMKYGTFDEYHLFLSNRAHVTHFLREHAPVLEALGVQRRIQVFHRLALPTMAATNDYTVFHQSDHINYFNRLCRVRNRIGAGFPVTGFIHSISYQQYMQSYLEMASLGAGPNDALVCSSHSGRQVLERCFDRIEANRPSTRKRVKMEVVPLGIDEGEAVPEKRAARRRLGFDASEVIGLVFGRFSDVDKMDLFPLMQAFEKVSPQGPFRLVLAGSVHSDTYLKMVELWCDALGLSKAVTILTEPTEETKRTLFGAADFFISLSDNPQETFGLTLLEAMWAGLPLLVSDFDGYKELVTDAVGIRVPTLWTEAGLLGEVEPLLDDRTFHLFASQSICVDVAQLTVSLGEMFRNGTARAAMAMESRRRFEDRFSHRHIISRLETLWEELKAAFRPSIKEEDWGSLDTFNTFSHYVTRRIDDADTVETTDFGKRILRQQGMHPMLPNMGSLIDNAVVVAMMGTATHPMSVSAFVSAAAPMSATPRYLLLWMLKHGLLTATRGAFDQYSE